MQQGVNERTVGMTRRRMHHHAPGLVYDDNVTVLVHDVERNVLRHKLGLLALRQHEKYLVAGAAFVIFPDGRTVYQHAAAVDEPLHGAAAERFHILSKESVDTLAALLCNYSQFVHIT